MNVRYFEGWVQHLLAGQPWVKSARTFAEANVNLPVGVVIEPAAGGQAVRIQFVRASPSVPSPVELPDVWTGEDALPVEPLQASPSSPKEWAAAVVSVVSAASHDLVKVAETFDDWGKSAKPAGARVAFTDGAEIFGTVLDAPRR